MNSLARSLVFLVVLVPVATAPQAGFAQSDFVGGVHFNTGLPQGELDDQIGKDAYGLGGQIFYAPSRSPLALGLDVSWLNYGNETRREPFSTTIPDVTVDVETQNNVVQGFLVLRGQMPRGPIQLYGDALLGLNYLYTETRIKDTDGWSEDVASSTNQEDVALAYGFGGGVMIPVWTGRSDGVQQVLIDSGVRYIQGGEAEYLKEGSIRRDGGRVSFDTIRSRTDMVKLHLGVSLRF